MKAIEEALNYIKEKELTLMCSPFDAGYLYKINSRYYSLNTIGTSTESIVEATNNFIENLLEEIRMTKELNTKHLDQMEKLLP